MRTAPIILWHIAISHFSEKVRWALDYKSIEHERRAPPPGLHMALVAWMTRGRAATLPMLELDGERIADSAAIIDALERRFPDPPLLPAAAAQRSRAHELEAYFDTQLGPFTRRLVFHELSREPQLAREAAASAMPAVAARLGPVLAPYTRALVRARYGAGDERRAEQARAKILLAMDRLEHELGEGDYLVDGRFTVADLTAASLLYPVVLPVEAPPALAVLPERYERFRESLRERRAYAWTQEMFARHRRSGHAQMAAA
jgi:glutathione S-transferase